MKRQKIASGDPNEDTYGYSRALRVGDMVWVSGTTAAPEDLDRETYGQMKSAIAIIAQALHKAEAGLDYVVRTVVYLRDMNDKPDVARAHREAFGAAQPASTLVEVSRLDPDKARVEIEVTAVLRNGKVAG